MTEKHNLQVQADVLAERAKRMAQRARDARKKAAKAEEERRQSVMQVLALSVLQHLSGLGDVERASFVTGIGLSGNERQAVLLLVPVPVEPTPEAAANEEPAPEAASNQGDQPVTEDGSL